MAHLDLPCSSCSYSAVYITTNVSASSSGRLVWRVVTYAITCAWAWFGDALARLARFVATPYAPPLRTPRYLETRPLRSTQAPARLPWTVALRSFARAC